MVRNFSTPNHGLGLKSTLKTKTCRFSFKQFFGCPPSGGTMSSRYSVFEVSWRRGTVSSRYRIFDVLCLRGNYVIYTDVGKSSDNIHIEK